MNKIENFEIQFAVKQQLFTTAFGIRRMGTYSKFPWRASQPLLPSAYYFPCPCFMYEHPRVVGNHLRRFAFLWHDRTGCAPLSPPQRHLQGRTINKIRGK
ncbi:hypothetical protein CDAR_91081 [Caerostris darwini]|uniref:Uncharacterized protein n=1 Tax=Caerostris darwini TaxID=1538125 RepID=A0AAV4Q9P5_9ARAC|nr:hypothetical protein CDAR_91081 [Caerostris darwini]